MRISLEDTKKLCLGTAILGLVCLAVFAPDEKNLLPGEINKGHLGLIVGSVGKIQNLEINNGNAFFELANGSTIKVVFFGPSTKEAALLKEGTLARVRGKVSQYEGNLQINASEVLPID